MPVAVLYYYYTLHGESAEEPKKPQETQNDDPYNFTMAAQEVFLKL